MQCPLLGAPEFSFESLHEQSSACFNRAAAAPRGWSGSDQRGPIERPELAG
jgi:hypothetical protein